MTCVSRQQPNGRHGLGNDHAHYLREWLDRDIVDLKLLIDLAVHWIDSELLTKQYETEMINKRPADKKQFDKQANVVQFPGSPPKDGSALIDDRTMWLCLIKYLTRQFLRVLFEP